MTGRSITPAIFQLEIIADDDNPATPAELDSMATEIRKALEEAGYEIRPAYTGTRGGELFDIIISEADKIADLVAPTFLVITTIVGAIKKHRTKSSQKGQEAQPASLEIAAPGQAQAVTAILGEQEIEIKQLQEQVRQLQEQIKQSQMKATLKIQQPKRKKRP